MYGTDVITIVGRIPKHTSILREQAQAQQINCKMFCQSKTLSKVLWIAKTFSKVCLLGLFVEYTFGEKLLNATYRNAFS
jgi:hypothetical protein